MAVSTTGYAWPTPGSISDLNWNYDMVLQDRSPSFKSAMYSIGKSDDYLQFLAEKIILVIKENVLQNLNSVDLVNTLLVRTIALCTIYHTAILSWADSMSGSLQSPRFSHINQKVRRSRWISSLKNKKNKIDNLLLRSACQNTEEVYVYNLGRGIDMLFRLKLGYCYNYAAEHANKAITWLLN